jgi:hypothetical protein
MDWLFGTLEAESRARAPADEPGEPEPSEASA